MAETYKDLRSFMRAVVLSRWPSSPSGDTSEGWIKTATDLLTNGQLGRSAQRHYDEHGEYPAAFIYEPDGSEPSIGILPNPYPLPIW